MLPITLCASRENLPPRPSVGSDSRIQPQRYKRASYLNRLQARAEIDRLVADGWRIYSQPRPTEAPGRGSFGEVPCLWISCHPEPVALVCYGWGLRFAGFADDLVGRGSLGSGIDHTGWLIREDDYSATYRGAVVLMPHGCAAPAVYDSESESLAISLRLSDWEERSADDTDNQYDTAEYIKSAARAADQWAERVAEESRESDAKYNRAARLAERLEELNQLGQFADGSRLCAYNPNQRETLLTLEALSREFMCPAVDSADWTGDRATIVAQLKEFASPDYNHREMLDDWPTLVDGSHAKRVFFSRLSAPGYLDATDWIGPFATIREAFEALAETYGDDCLPDSDDPATDPETLALIDDPECADHFPDPRADALLAAESYRLSFAGVGRHWIAFRCAFDCLELVRRCDGISLHLQGDDAETLRTETAKRGIDSAGDDYSALDIFNR